MSAAKVVHHALRTTTAELSTRVIFAEKKVDMWVWTLIYLLQNSH